MRNIIALILTAQIAFLGACASTPEESSEIRSLKQEIESIDSLEMSESEKQYAPIAVEEAREAVDKLNKMAKADADKAEYEHQLYLTKKKIEIAKEMVKMEKAEEIIANSELRRKDVLLSAGQQQLKAERQQLKEERQQVKTLKDQAAQMMDRAKELQQQVQNLKTEKTERGLVLTLESVLFETGSATVQSGSVRTLQQVAKFLNEYPDRDILIEGFTDDRGEEKYNQQLSQQRAQEVKRVLTRNDVKASRVQTEGYGESYPVANNSTPAGRQQNRRVEIVIATSNHEDIENRTTMRK